MTTNIITATITAYCACKLCCGNNAKGICANNKPPTQNHTIAASRIYPFGTRVRIEGKEYVVEDRLALRFDKRFDIFFASHNEAKKYGIKKNVQVTIITK
jgi:peptidoglycan DL-endopeptidase CwlO